MDGFCDKSKNICNIDNKQYQLKRYGDRKNKNGYHVYEFGWNSSQQKYLLSDYLGPKNNIDNVTYVGERIITESERKAREAERKAREAAVREEAERKAREVAVREEAERKAREAAVREEAERKTREAATVAAAAREEAEQKAREIGKEKKISDNCVNRESPIVGEDVEDLEVDELIVLSNGGCWDIETLISFIRETAKGLNDARKLKTYMPTYPSNKIWENNSDYLKIISHPVAKKDKLKEFIESRQVKLSDADNISDQTMEVLYLTGSLLWSRGPPFNKEIERILEPNLLQVWNVEKQKMSDWELSDDIVKAKEGPLLEIRNIINDQIKARAILTLDEYIQSLNLVEKNSLNQFDFGIVRRINKCAKGIECMMQIGDSVLKVYNKIAKKKDNYEVLDLAGLK